MNNKIVVFLLSFYILTIGQTKLEYEKNDGNKLKLKFNSHIDYSKKKENNNTIFLVPNYHNEAAPGDVKLPSQSVFISLPFVEIPKVKYKVTSSENINAIPEFNDKVELKNEKLLYSKATTFTNTKTKHFITKGYLWIGDKYCLHLEITPAVYLSSQNLIEYVRKFEIELQFNKSIPQNTGLKKSSKTNSIIANTSFEFPNYKNKYSLNNSDSWIDYTKNYVKIGTASDGIYRISKFDLENLGVNISSINPKSLKIILRGKEIPIFVKGEGDLTFDFNDYIEFVGIRNMGGHHRELSNFGEPYNEYLGRYTDTTIYWLTWNGDEGKRVDVSFGNEVTTNDTLEYYSQIDHYEKNNWFDYSSSSQVEREKPFWIENKTWHEGGLKVRINNKGFTVHNVYPNKSCKLLTKFQDYASNISLNAHYVTLGLNSKNWGDSLYLNKYQKIILKKELNSNLLKNGNNYLSINSMATQASLNVCIFDWYEIEYPRYLFPINDSLKFTFPFLQSTSIKTIKLQNINSDNFLIWKYGEKYKKFNLANNIDSKVVFSDTVFKNDKYIYMDEVKVRTPKFYYLKKFKNLRNSEIQADYIAVTHNKFENKTNDYLQFITNSYSINTKLINIYDIYDEFSYGFFNPESIKDFLITTQTNWLAPKPKYVSLIGGATYDYFGNKHKNFGIKRVLNYIPSFGAPVSDTWFVMFDTTSAYIPQMNIGRIPVTTNEEFDWYFEKHRNYVIQKYDEWNKKYLFFSGGDESKPAELNSLRQANQFIIDNYVVPSPIGGEAYHFFKTVNPITNFGNYSKKYIKNSIDNGGIFISYIGHSGTQTWDNSIIEPKQLMNKQNRYPIVSDFGCSTGKFAEPDVTSFSELFLLNQNGQALAYIGNSSLGFLQTSLLMPKLFYKKLLRENIHNVSEAHKQAKIDMLKANGTSTIYQLSALTNLYFGDPVLTLPIPIKTNFVIDDKLFSLNSNLITDLNDTIEIKIKFNNYGAFINDSLDILVLHQFNSIYDTISLRRKIPNLSDSISVKINTSNKSGEHKINVVLDPFDKLDEIYENDNLAQFSFYVYSSSIRPLISSQILNGINERIKFINPSSKPENEVIIFEIATNEKFIDKTSYEIKFDSISSNFIFNNLEQDIRYWGRTKIKGDNNYSAIFSFLINGEDYYLADSLSFNKVDLSNIYCKNNSINIDTTKIKFEVLSAGYSDGNTVLILKNSVDFVKNVTIRGHYIAVFKDSTYENVQSLHFDFQDDATIIQKYISFLDTISSNNILCFAIKDDGATNLTQELRNKIKEFGSVLIDSVKFRNSWAFIGKRGARPGSMPESFSREGEGSVTIDTTISFLAKEGSMLTSEIGDVGKWQKLVVNQELPDDSKITYTPIGITKNGIVDTLAQLIVENSEATLSNIDANKYPKLKILAKFYTSTGHQSPILNSLGVDYDIPSELATNYQVVSVEQDSVQQGENAKLSFFVYNVGETKADSFKVLVEVIKPDNSKEKVFEQLIDSLGAEKRKLFNVSYNTINSNGARTFSISIDSENKVKELYEDNNYYSIPFYVKGDTTKPTMLLSIDGNDIFEGEYVSSKPKIRIELSEPSTIPITDTNAISIYLNNRRISYRGHEDIMKINYSQSNPKVIVNYSPTLIDGDYELKAYGQDASGNVTDSSSIRKSFIVSGKAKIMDIYNYPNPMTNDTYFTFKLTKMPDEITIRIFTIAGRMIKEIVLDGSQLNYDLNKIFWDGLDSDGDEIGNGIYLYKVIMDVNGNKQVQTKKLAVVK